jgi:predicted short-subunit dehydrogenase-like oxidoreductase (DUF2520 family)
MIINIIGAGKLGKTLAHLWARTDSYQIGGVITTHPEHTKAAIDFIGQGSICHQLKDLPKADLTLIATPDDKIATVCQNLYQEQELPKHHIVFHCSGSLTRHILAHPERKDVLTATIHPIKSFMQPELAVNQFTPTLCALESPPRAESILSHLFQSIGCQIYNITSDKKALYHAGCVFASNYLIAVAHHAFCCFLNSGLEAREAKQFTQTLLSSSLSNLHYADEIKEALTGPLQRGDIDTLSKHLDALNNTDQKLIYQELGKTLIQLTNHHPEFQQILRNLLETT